MTYQGQERPIVIANLLLGQNLRAVREGRSRGLSFPADRKRFHELRAQADLILIGGNTARNEPYGSTPVPLVVLSRHSLPELTERNPLATVRFEPLESALTELKGRYRHILIEAGPLIIREALTKKLADRFYLSISNIDGDLSAPEVNLTEALSNYELEERQEVEGGSFLVYSLAPTSKK